MPAGSSQQSALSHQQSAFSQLQQVTGNSRAAIGNWQLAVDKIKNFFCRELARRAPTKRGGVHHRRFECIKRFQKEYSA
jgi:hypothetical protein